MTCLETEFTSRGYELDADGLVSAHVFLRYMEHQRWEYFRRVTPEVVALFRGGHTFVMVAQTLQIAGDIGLATPIRGTLWIGRTGRTSIDFRHVFHRIDRIDDGVLLASGSVTAVYLDPHGAPIPLPDSLRLAEADPPETVKLNPPGFGVAPPKPFERVYHVRTWDIDLLRHMNHANYAAIYDDARHAASTSHAYGPAGPESGRVRFLHIEYSNPALLGDELTVATWLAGTEPITLGFELRRDSVILSRAVARV